MGLRIGQGYDAHRLVPGRPLILGGVRIDHPLGLDGHSDADVLAHALGDALLGAAGLGDLGRHFPDSDPVYKGVDSLDLLTVIALKMTEAGYRLVNADATLIAQKPKIAPHIDQMRTNLALALGVDDSLINVKATTTEKMGFPGREEGMAALAVALIESI